MRIWVFEIFIVSYENPIYSLYYDRKQVVITVKHYNRAYQGDTITVPIKKLLSTDAINSVHDTEIGGVKLR